MAAGGDDYVLSSLPEIGHGGALGWNGEAAGPHLFACGLVDGTKERLAGGGGEEKTAPPFLRRSFRLIQMQGTGSGNGGLKVPRVLVQVCVLMLSMTLLSVIFNLIVCFAHLSIDGSILSSAEERYGDFTVYQPKFLFFHQASFFSIGYPFTYPAPVALAYEFFFRVFRSHALIAFQLFCVLAFLVPAGGFASAIRKRGLTAWAASGFTVVLVVTSWPAILVFDRGNMEVLVWVVLAAATFAYSTGRGYLAASLFGVAAAMKLFPFVFLALFFSRRQWSKLIVGVLVFLSISVVSLEILGPSLGFAYRQITAGIDFFRLNYMAQWNSRVNGVDHSMFSFYKFVAKATHPHLRTDFQTSLAVYLNVMALAGMALYLIRIRRLPMLNQLMCLSIASIYFTAFSGDGTLLHLYYPFVLLVFLAIRAERERRIVPGLRAALLLLGFILSITTFITWHRQMLEGEAKCVAIGALLVLALTKPFGPALEDGAFESELADTLLPNLGHGGLPILGAGAIE